MASKYEDMVGGDWAGDPLQSAAAGPTCRAMLRALQLTTTMDGLVCDVGCGPGFSLRWLAAGAHDGISKDRLAELRGFDVSCQMIELAQKRCCPPLEASQFSAADMTDLSSVLAEGSSRCLFNLCTVQHFGESEIRAMLSSSRRSLKPGGILLLQFWSGDTDAPMSPPEAPDAAVFLQWTRETMARWVQLEGLSVTEESEGLYEFEPGTPGQSYRFLFLKA